MQYLRGGNILRVNLSTGEIQKVPTSRYDKYLGGRAIQVKILYDEVGPEVDAMSPDNLLMLGTGPFTGTLVPGSGRTEVTAKSPMTGVVGMSNFGGYFAAEVKFAGYDHIVIKGKAEKPVYLYINNDDVQIRDASGVWGRDCYDTPSIIRKEVGDPDVQVVCIGKAGENLVRYATLQHKVGDGAGRTGMGCVMGSKNLKAVAVRGSKGVKTVNPDAFFAECENAQNLLKATPRYKGRQGPYGEKGNNWGFQMDDWGKLGIAQTKNFRETNPERAYKEYAMDEFVAEQKPQRTGCFACPLKCMDNFRPYKGHDAIVASCMLFLESNWKTEMTDHEAWYETVEMCQKDGLDPASAGNFIGWAMELYERGIITEKDTDGIPLVWGSTEAVLAMFRKIVNREGFGDVLADNPEIVLKKLGKKEAAQYLMHVKGNPLYNWNPLNFKFNSLATAVGNRGDIVRGQLHTDNTWHRAVLHNNGDIEKAKEFTKAGLALVEKITGNADDIQSLTYDGKAKLVVHGERVTAVADMLLECKIHTPWSLLHPMNPDRMAPILSAATGEKWTGEMLMEKADMCVALERAYNAREGMTRADDTLPDRMFSKTPQPGIFKDDVLDRDKFEQMKDEYYTLRGWDVKTGVPTRETLGRLGLAEVAEDLASRGKLPQPVAAAVPVGAGAKSSRRK